MDRFSGKIILTVALASFMGVGFGSRRAGANPVIRTGPNGGETIIERRLAENGTVDTTITGPRGREYGFNARFEDGRLIRRWRDGRETSVRRTWDGNAVNTTRTGPNGRQLRYSTTRDSSGGVVRTYSNGRQVRINRSVRDGRLYTTRTGPKGRSGTWTSEIQNGQVVHTGPGGRRWSVRRR